MYEVVFHVQMKPLAVTVNGAEKMRVVDEPPPLLQLEYIQEFSTNRPLDKRPVVDGGIPQSESVSPQQPLVFSMMLFIRIRQSSLKLLICRKLSPKIESHFW